MSGVNAEGRIPRRASISTFVRSFAIQGSWNYRTMIGQGFAFALLPILRHVHRADREALERAVERHANLFNAHPYMAELALGAVARMEAEGRSPESIERFKEAARGPLGSLGDQLIWAGALPAAALVGLVVLAAGAPPWLPPAIFLVVYNAGHLTLRIWGFRAGLREGAGVATRISTARLSKFAERLAAAGTFLIGVLIGLVSIQLLTGGGGPGRLALVAGAGALALGQRLGNQAWRFAALATVLIVLGGLGFGAFS